MKSAERSTGMPPRLGPERDGPDAYTRWVTRLVGALLLLVLALWMLQSYLVALGWAVIIAVSIWPLYARIRAQMRGSNLVAPLLVTLALAILLIFPIALVLAEIGQEAQFVMEWISRAEENGVPVPAWTRNLPLVGMHLNTWWQSHLSQPQAVKQLLSGLNPETITEWSRTLGGALASSLLLVLIAFTALFLLLRHGEEIGGRVLAMIDKWFGTPGERLAENMAVVVRGTVNGTILVAIGEGLLIGASYVVAHVPYAFLFTILTIAFAMLPMGAWFAFAAAAVTLLLNGGSFVAAAAVFGWGAAVMLTGDNVVQPALIGGAARLPFLWALVGILGGLETFGLIGLFLGPVIMAALLTIWRKQSDPALVDGL